MKHRYCLALDLADDPEAIRKYEDYHRAVWPEVLQSLTDAGIDQMEIYRTGNRLMMIIETRPGFSFEHKAALDAANSTVQKWESLMSPLQQALPWAAPGTKWTLMDKIFSA